MTDAQAANALLTEHLHYTPLSLIDDIINSINNLIYQGISSLESGLLSQPPSRLGFSPSNPSAIADETDLEAYPDAKLEIENGLHQLETLLESTVDKNFDKLEIYVLRNILTVPEELVPWVRLGCYEDLKVPREGERAPDVESLSLLRKSLGESLKLERALLAEKRKNEAVIAQLRGMLDGRGPAIRETGSTKRDLMDTEMDMSFLNVKETAVGGGSLTTNTTFMLSQLPALRATLASLRPRLAGLPMATERMELDEGAADRKEYIENGARKGMERTGGMETVQVPGSRRDKAEVEALERLMGTWEKR